MGERIGIFGGTFDPIHSGHLIVAVNVRDALALDRVLLVVANRPWQKVGSREVTPARLRLELAQAAVAGLEGIEVSDIEIRRGGDSYTADTLVELKSTHPGAELFLILGADAARALPSWERPDEARRISRLVVVSRPGVEPVSLPEGWNAVEVRVPGIEVSSTDLRARAADGRPLDFLMPPAAIDFVRSRGLYTRSW
jgi:nicotinate-nucleotide adenylyltransferase